MKTALRVSLLTAMTLPAGLVAQIPQPQLVMDINRTSSRHSLSSFPEGMTADHNGFWRQSRYAAVGPNVFFKASETSTGSELYYADATPGSAALVMDIHPGMNGSSPGNFLVLGDKVYFTADDGTNGYQVWEAMVVAGNPTVRRLTSLSGTASDTAIGPMIAGKVGSTDTIYFTKFDAMAGSFLIHGVELPGGSVTKVPAQLDKQWNQPTRIGNKILFRGSDFRGDEAWWLDDNPSADVLKDYGSGNGMCEYPVLIGNKVYFAASSGTWALYSWDGQNPVEHVAALPGAWVTPVVLGTKIVFEWGGLPYAVDTAAPTPTAMALPNELAGNTFKTAIYHPVVMGGKAYYYGYSMVQPVAAYYLFETDGITAQLIPGTRNNNFGSWWSHPEVVNDAAIYFNFKSTGAGWSLHKYDGSTFTRFQIHKSTTRSANPSNMTALGDKVLFQAEDGLFGHELWVSNGTQQGTELHTNISTQMRTDGSFPGHFAPLGRRMMFAATDGVHGREPWVTDGERPKEFPGFGTGLYADVEPGPMSSDPKEFASDERRGGLIWIDGEVRIALDFSGWDIVDGVPVQPEDWENRFSTALGDILVDAIDPVAGKEPHVVNPVTKKAELVADLNPGAGSGRIASKVNVGKKTFGVGKHDLTVSGFVTLGEDLSVTETPIPTDFEPTGNLVCIDDLTEKIAYKGVDSFGLPFAAAYSLKQHTFSKFLTAVGQFDAVFEEPFTMNCGAVFRAREGMDDFLFWTDGTSANTVKLSNTPIFGIDNFHNTLTQKDEFAVELGQTDWKIFFPAVNNLEVWKTNGTTAERVGSLELYDVTEAISLGGSRVAFIGNNDATGFEVFVTDGMTIHNISEVLAPGPADGTHWGAGLWAMNGKLFFSGRDALGAGSELFSWDAGALAQPFGIGTDPRIRFRAADPKIGGAASFSIAGAPMNSNLAIAVFGAPAVNSFLFANERVYVDILGAQSLAIFLNQGAGSLQFPIPNDPSLLGLHMVVQAAILPYLNLLGMALTYPQMLTLGM